MSAPVLVDRVAEHIPRAGLLELVSVLEELKRRARSGRQAPQLLIVVVEIDPATGEVLGMLVPHRYGED